MALRPERDGQSTVFSEHALDVAATASLLAHAVKHNPLTQADHCGREEYYVTGGGRPFALVMHSPSAARRPAAPQRRRGPVAALNRSAPPQELKGPTAERYFTAS
ncbi:hypothetical protein [Kitasatospora cathayae]|uniref:Uncharacterized protein n=1 Tax=Kitasatospora cathayae TaxID=3004092 RepID=A0ABY7QJ68_9ACTN|nr:hypothetical protein [Kitasatospora sp. HUAS 3-15]WBP91944.1 hypothetical protein O1G21_39835 [Kitasatospora sp. HUAS 3-15]